MRSPPVLLVVLAAVGSVIPVAAQPPPRDPQAIVQLQRAITAMGGAGAISEIRDCRAEGVVQASPGSWLITGSFVWKNRESEFRYENPGPLGQSVFVSGRRRPAVIRPGRTVRLFAHMAEANFPPHLAAVALLKALQDSRYSVVFVGQEAFGGIRVTHIQTSLQTDALAARISSQEWFFDLSSGLPVRVEYRLPSNHNANEFMKAAVEYSDFRMVSGVAIPFQFVVYHDGQRGGAARLNSVVFNSGMSPAEFDPPAGGAL